jgi:carboxyl-terminal processing protease
VNVVFTQTSPLRTSTGQSGTSSAHRSKVQPLSRSTRSGKEILAYGFKKYRLGEVIGTRTEGAVLAATAFFIGGGLLLLAVQDVHVDGERLEGVGVAPTIELQADPDSMDRSDPQLNRAIAVLSGVGRQPAGSYTVPEDRTPQ